MAEPKKPAPAKPPDPVAVTTQAGKTGYLPAEFAKDAADAGARRATDAEMQREQVKANEIATAEELAKKFDGHSFTSALEGEVMPQAAGLLRGLSLGTSDAAILSAAELIAGPQGRESVRQRLLDYQDYAPVRSTAGEVGGMVAGVAAGEGLLGAGPGVASRLGGAAERLVGGGLPGMVARGAAEGTAFGAGDTFSEKTLHGEDITAEALIGGAAHGALGGALAAGAFGAAGKALSGLRAPKATAAAVEDLATRAYGEAAPGVGRALAEEANAAATPYRTSAARAAGEGAFDAGGSKYIEHVPSLAAPEREKLGEAWANRERVFKKHAETVENASRDFSNTLNEALEAGRKADMASFGDSKINQMSKLVDPSRFADQAAVATRWVADANETIGKFADDATAGMTKGARKQWAAWQDHVAKAVESGDSLMLHTTLDHMKRFVGKQAQFGVSPFGLSTAAREFDALYQGESGIKGLLESNVWGERAARAQQDINGATHLMLSEGRMFTRKFTTEFGSEMGRPLYTADTSAVSGFMNRLTSAANDLDAKGVESWVQARKHFLNAIERSYTFEGEAAAAITKERAALEKLDGVYRQTTKDVTLANQVKAALQEERERGIGGAIGAVMDIANKPYTTLQRLAQIEAHTKSVLDKVAGGTRELVGAGSAAAKAAPMMKPAASGKSFFTALLDGMGKVAPAAGAAGSRELFRQRAESIAKMQAQPALVTERVTQALAPLGDAAPNVTTAATTLSLRALDFLAGKLPPSRLDPFSLQPQLSPKWRSSDAEISQFMRYNAAIDDPLIVLRDAKAGTLTRDSVEAVKAVYPAMYDEMRGAVMRSLVESTSPLPYGKRIQLGILLDLPTDKTLSPDFLRAIQATYSGAEKAGAESPPPNIAPPELAGSAQTATQSAVERAM